MHFLSDRNTAAARSVLSSDLHIIIIVYPFAMRLKRVLPGLLLATSLVLNFLTVFLILRGYTCQNPYNMVKLHEQRLALTSRLELIMKSKMDICANSVKDLHSEAISENFDIQPAAAMPEKCSSTRICDEVYLGNNADQPWHQRAWSLLEEGCKTDIGKLLTILLLGDHNTPRIVEDIREQYASIPIIIGLPSSSKKITKSWQLDSFVKVHELNYENEGSAWKELVDLSDTEFVFIGHNLLRLPKFWGNFERYLRMMDAKNAAAVAGATKNSTGHWRSHCWQSKISGYNLVLTPGYHQSQCDCMKCNLLWDSHGPFVARRIQLQNHLMPQLSIQIAFAHFFLTLQSLGYHAYTCPDLMLLTASDLPPPSQNEWLKLAKIWHIQGISIDLGPLKIHQFSCATLGLACNPEVQTKSFIVPWCCHIAAFHVFKSMQSISEKTGVHYELNSGSLLGAVKLHNFIPWDIDGDMYVPTEQIHHYHKGGVARLLLETDGITFHSWSADNYWDKGAGHYQLSYQGLEFELMGKRGNLTLQDGKPPTLILYGDAWVRVHNHPGQYARGRYGPRYLRHAQSWKFLETMNGAFDSYGGQQWTHCSDPGHHACLELYPSDGNVLFLPHRYP